MSESAAPPIKLFIGELHPEEGQKKNKCSVRFTFLSRHAHCIEVLHQNNYLAFTIESGIDVGQGITVGPGKFFKKNKRRA